MIEAIVPVIIHDKLPLVAPLPVSISIGRSSYLSMHVCVCFGSGKYDPASLSIVRSLYEHDVANVV